MSESTETDELRMLMSRIAAVSPLPPVVSEIDRRRAALVRSRRRRMAMACVAIAVLASASAGAFVVVRDQGESHLSTDGAAAPFVVSVPQENSATKWESIGGMPLQGKGEPVAAGQGDQVSVWLGNEIGAGDLATYDVKARTWSTAPSSSGLSPRYGAIGLWTGTEFLVWGGRVGTQITTGDFNNGALYSPSSRSWRPVPPSPIGARSDDAAFVWTGSELLVWGGRSSSSELGAAFNVAQGAWRLLPAAPIASRFSAASSWTGSELILWGGAAAGPSGGLQNYDDGAAYNPTSDNWRRISQSPLGGRATSATWSGTEMFVIGGAVPLRAGSGFFVASDGAAYDPLTDKWRKISDGPSYPGGGLAWLGNSLFVAIGKGYAFLFDPSRNAWKTLERTTYDEGPTIATSAGVIVVSRNSGGQNVWLYRAG